MSLYYLMSNVEDYEKMLRYICMTGTDLYPLAISYHIMS